MIPTTCHFVLQTTHANNKQSPRLHETYGFEVRIHKSTFKNAVLSNNSFFNCEILNFQFVEALSKLTNPRFGAQNCNFYKANLHMSFCIANHICKWMVFQKLSDSSHQTTSFAWFRSAKPPVDLQKTLYCRTINCRSDALSKRVYQK